MLNGITLWNSSTGFGAKPGPTEDVNHYIAVVTDGTYDPSSRVAEQKYIGERKPIVQFFTTKNFTINDTKPLVLEMTFC
jgi:hypothetical protein